MDRDLDDARDEDLSSDWRFAIAYNAALKLCTILLYGSGFRPERNRAHYRTLRALPEVLGAQRRADAAYLDACRIKRNTVEYDYAGATTVDEAVELIRFANTLRDDVLEWLRTNRPDLLT
ncbi:MAG: hypothetical protein R6V58_03270 [Planctomycetota bacterium]